MRELRRRGKLLSGFSFYPLKTAVLFWVNKISLEREEMGYSVGR